MIDSSTHLQQKRLMSFVKIMTGIFDALGCADVHNKLFFNKGGGIMQIIPI